jgi:hypothetical protein
MLSLNTQPERTMCALVDEDDEPLEDSPVPSLQPSYLPLPGGASPRRGSAIRLQLSDTGGQTGDRPPGRMDLQRGHVTPRPSPVGAVTPLSRRRLTPNFPHPRETPVRKPGRSLRREG